MMTVFRWNGTTCAQGGSELLPATAADVPADQVVWLELTEPTPDEESTALSKFLPVHPLTLEDATRIRRDPAGGAHFPKVEEFPDYLLVVVNPLPPGLLAQTQGKPTAGTPAAEPSAPTHLSRRNRPQLSAILTRNVLVTHATQSIDCVVAARRHLERHGTMARRGPDYLFHLILDAMVDEYAPVVEWVAGRLDRLETAAFTRPTRQLLARLLRLKRVVSGMRKTLILEREVLARLTRGEFDLVDEREIVYYRNVYDHLVRYTELIESAREMISDLAELHLAAVSNRLNEIMKVLAMISTIVLPMTLIAGVYGMNFEENVWPGFKTQWGFAFAVGLMLLTGVVALLLFRWRKWF